MSLTRVPRRFPALLLALLALVAIPGAAAAKTPPFTVEVTPPGPTAGEPITVILRFSGGSPPPAALDGLVAFQLDGGNDQVPLSFDRSADGSYRAEVILPAGSWTLVPFPDDPLPEAVPGYPQPIPVLVSATLPAPASPSLPPALLMIGVAVVLIIGLAAVSAQRRRRPGLPGAGTLATQRGLPTVEKPSR